ncbi:cofactor assembly of complex C subunit B [Anthocerotibacter panamensis]|uniref:cofactor assembly of complex C subunit B n=1 Tax=Anthocerotibacter panamensis TaxID=2857077 RepID=UPI001C401FEA|nr:cofactor assembly of complex C subunit B [Anthocerotibacter panamensis]
MLRTLPIVIGILGSGLLVVNRMVAFNPTPEQTRSDALGLMMGAVLVLVGLLARQIQPLPAETVPIEAPQGTELAPVSPLLAQELRWLAQTLSANTATVSIFVWFRDQTLLRAGYLGSGAFAPGPIVQRVLKTQKPVYLVALNLFPGRVEFSYLPESIQALICQPLGTAGILVLGSDRVRSYSPQDLKWIAALSERLTTLLETMPLG